jgi:DNA invertase Pin-like site-specific DNA recombinase
VNDHVPVRRAAIYARVSTDEQAKGTSLAAQVDRCRAAAAAKSWDIVGEFVDEGVSGALRSRPRLDALVRLVEDDQVDVIAITKLDRIARSLRHLLDLLDLLEQYNVTLCALDDPLDPSTASGRAMVHLRGVFAELERQLIRERTTEGLRRRVESGGWPGGPPPYGYKIVDHPHGAGRVLTVEEDEAAVIRLAYKLIAEDGYTTGEAAAELRRLGTRPRRSPEWEHRILRRLLLNARGLSGRWPWRRAGRDGRTEADEIIVDVPAILDPLEHERLLAVLSASSTQPAKWQTYLLRGRVTSPHGVRMQGVPSHNGTRWYRCPHRPSHRLPDVERCGCGRLHAPTVEQAVWEEVMSLLGDPAALETLAVEHETARGGHASRERGRIAALDTRIANTETEIAEEYAALRDEGFDPGAARAAIRKRNERLIALRKERDQLLRLRGKNLAAAGLAGRLRSLATQARVALDAADDTVRRRIVDLLDLRVEVVRWEPCETCDGNGLLARPGPRSRDLAISGGRRREPIICPDCLRTRHIPLLRISGQVPELLLAALADGADIAEIASDVGSLLPFEAAVRVA